MDPLSNITITQVDATTFEGIRPHVVGRNARLGVHGWKVKDTAVRLHTNTGIAGFGWSNATKEEAQLLVGQKLQQIFDPTKGTIERFLHFDYPLWDLAGRILEKPVYELLGAKGCPQVRLYDSSIYFDDLEPESGSDRGLPPILEEVEQGLKRGFRAFKIKVGRGYKWMETTNGFIRDCDVIRTIREKAGPRVLLLIDANNGYTPTEAREVMHSVGDSNLFWFEEPFPETKDECLSFRRFLDEHGWETLIADGEAIRDPESATDFTEIVYAGGVDVVQFDWRPFTLTQWLQYVRKLLRKDVFYAPHNWGSYFGGFYVAHFCRGLSRGLMVEWDSATMPWVNAEGYALSEGFLKVPEKPGFGLEVDGPSLESAIADGKGWSVRT